MAKGDWEVYEDEDTRPVETPAEEKTPCELYGHSYELTNDYQDTVRTCNDCGQTDAFDPEK